MPTTIGLVRAFALALAFTTGGRATGEPTAPPVAEASTPAPLRALWVTRWDYRAPADVRRVVAEAADLGVTDLLWQVRGQADAFYPSPLEPWGQELFLDLPDTAATPGYDPLALALAEAHARGLRLHAWFNVMPLWKGTTPPRAAAHPLLAHPEFRLLDAAGRPQPLNDHYVIFNPVLPEVQDHIVAVARDIMARYAVDGLHLDYVRFVSETLDPSLLYPGDPRSIALFRAATGAGATAAPDLAPAETEPYRAWIRSRITDLVRRLREEAVATRPGALLTAAVWRRPETARDVYLQDAALWLHEGLIDRAFPMIYTTSDEQAAGDVAAWLAAAPGLPVTPGLGTYRHPPDQTPRQADAAAALGTHGVAFFAYAALFESVNPLEAKDDASRATRAARLAAVRAWLHALRARDPLPASPPTEPPE